MRRFIAALVVVAAGTAVVQPAQEPAAASRLNRLIEKIERGGTAMGTVNRQAPRSLDAARELAVRDLDFAVFDIEGGVTDLRAFEASLQVLRDPAVLGPGRRPISPIVRIPRAEN